MAQVKYVKLSGLWTRHIGKDMAQVKCVKLSGLWTRHIGRDMAQVKCDKLSGLWTMTHWEGHGTCQVCQAEWSVDYDTLGGTWHKSSTSS